MRVRAIKPAFFNATLVSPGTEVEVPDDLVGNWFVPVDGAPQVAEKPKAERRPKALSEVAKESAPQTFNDVMSKKDDIA